jgi:hypothetical protein
MSEYVIEKEVEIPTRTRTKYPWMEMNVGDSFFVPVPDSGRSAASIRASLYASGRGIFKKWPEYRIVVRKSNRLGVNGLRVWLTEKEGGS